MGVLAFRLLDGAAAPAGSQVSGTFEATNLLAWNQHFLFRFSVYFNPM
jgi:hypothetical protein